MEYLEDIIGSNKYVEDTNLAAAKVEALSEQRQEKLNRVKAVEKERTTWRVRRSKRRLCWESSARFIERRTSSTK